MAVVKIYDQAKQEAGEMTLAPEVFEVPVRPEILNLVVRSIRAAKRAGTHSTLTRSMMKGGGVKPWRQKGTGRARSGSNISPIWTGGAVTFGPQPRDYSFKVNKKVRALAMKMALSARQFDQNIMVVKSIELPEAKTKHFASVAKALELGKALVVVPAYDEALERSARNIPGITVTTPDQLNVYTILVHPQLVLLEGAVEPLTARLK
ncbi:50S ribosomal protein L4 [uncultured delta proteobacterium]|uniref:Large ribosomal subunit protein uL4 n=1 Tax=uncultured delta proteobacterium TaxID=34034 RepID=A0A212KF34_9DELT|nr:50S ribosomal protein L4 [uncultured delta proteobacterium]